ncbi:uncharacterized protein BYT42DRAFT_551922 [Radiomyces spectabilis]|uniref:uncharacterized protein n=1 Tax=Radiomyces spectabilis TaxID=64574 RepID=UPI00221ED13C|nr:uncharacterized protein BYT42DRAFT_551922 [Radiomyces spectabilis]KAI8393693.1 hypothetical protein BYT42DRAFT_551922 [Radiomyces spectabilis]
MPTIVTTTVAQAASLPTPISSGCNSPVPKYQKMVTGYDFPINEPPVGRPVRVYCDGIYDMFHFGHAKALEQAKRAFNDVYLLVGVCNDEVTHRRKGKTVMTDAERYEAVRHCKWVDEVIENAPWVVTQEFLDKHQIDYVAHDAEPYKSAESGDVYSFVKAQGKFLPTQRTDGVSTSDLITRIVRNYNVYLRRNLERGVSAEELNISYFKEQQVWMTKSIESWQTVVKDQLESWENRAINFIRDRANFLGSQFVMDYFLGHRGRLNEAGRGTFSSDCPTPITTPTTTTPTANINTTTSQTS